MEKSKIHVRTNVKISATRPAIIEKFSSRSWLNEFHSVYLNTHFHKQHRNIISKERFCEQLLQNLYNEQHEKKTKIKIRSRNNNFDDDLKSTKCYKNTLSLLLIN